MNPSCHAVRAALLEALEAGQPPLLGAERRAHLATCASCRRLCGEEEALDALLEQAAAAPSPDPAELDPAAAERVVARLREALDRALWSALDRLPEPDPPSSELLQRVLAAARAEDDDSLRDVELEPVRRSPAWVRPLLAAAAAGVLAWVGLRDGSLEVPEPAVTPDEQELLAWLDVLEQWDELEALEPVELEALAVLDPGDALLMEWGGGQ